MAAERREDARVRWATLAMSALATVALEQAVLEPGRSRGVVLASTAGLLLAPALAVAVYLGRRDRAETASRGRAMATLVGLFALPLAINAGRWLVTGRYVMPEIALLACLRNLGLGLAVMVHRPTYARLSALVSLFLVTVASPVGGEGGFAVLAPVGGFAVAGTLWLMLAYWKAFGLTAAARFPASGVTWVLGIVALVAAVVAVGPSRAATALAGLVPASGGTEWSDPDARSGVGDGDHEVSASEHPQSVGFTESAVYLETDRPSLYDAFSESYGEPFKPKRLEKMIALGQQDIAEQKERPAENLQAGHEFTAVRRKPESRPRRPGERAAKAMVYVKGPTPLHLPLNAYSEFDGVAWQEEPPCNRDFPALPEPRSAWLRLPWSVAPFLAETVSHQIKIGTLDSSPLPVPAHLRRFRVGSVNRPDFFGWAQYGIVRMTDRTVPAGTVIDTEARTVDPDRLRESPFTDNPSEAADRHLAFLGGYVANPAVRALAQRWTAGRARGWGEVEAVIDALRRDYAHDRSATAPAECTDVVTEFLLRSRRGPDYLFASSAAVLLRSLGYPARVVSGLYADPGRYDHRTRHTPVTAEDVHFWAEVRTPDGVWVAVEPTPGYELMPPAHPWTVRLTRALSGVGRWAARHAAALLAGALVLVALWARRRELLDALATLELRLGLLRDPRQRVLRTLNLVERRARWAGRPRPSGLTPARWYQAVAGQVEREAAAPLEELIRLAGWALHAPGPPGWRSPADDEIEQTCRAAVRAWTLARFRAAFSPRPRKVATT